MKTNIAPGLAGTYTSTKLTVFSLNKQNAEQAEC